MRYFNSFLIVFMLLLPSLMLAQTPDIYWGLGWTMSTSEVDSALQDVSVEVKKATKTLYDEARQIKGFAYRIDQKGVQKVYVWYHEDAGNPVQIHSIEIVYRFEYPYDAHRFKQGYFEKYGRSFEAQPVSFETPEGATAFLRTIEEPETGKLGNSVYLVTLMNPTEYTPTEENTDFLY